MNTFPKQGYINIRNLNEQEHKQVTELLQSNNFTHISGRKNFFNNRATTDHIGWNYKKWSYTFAKHESTTLKEYKLSDLMTQYKEGDTITIGEYQCRVVTMRNDSNWLSNDSGQSNAEIYKQFGLTKEDIINKFGKPSYSGGFPPYDIETLNQIIRYLKSLEVKQSTTMQEVLTSFDGIKVGDKLTVISDKSKLIPPQVKYSGKTVTVTKVDDDTIEAEGIWWMPKYFVKQASTMHTITRKQLQDNINLACTQWKERITAECKDLLFKDKIEVSEKFVQELRQAAVNVEQGQALDKLFPRPKEEPLVQLVEKAIISLGSSEFNGLIQEGNRIMKKSCMANGEMTIGAYKLLVKVDEISPDIAYTAPGNTNAWFHIVVRNEKKFREFLNDIITT